VGRVLEEERLYWEIRNLEEKVAELEAELEEEREERRRLEFDICDLEERLENAHEEFNDFYRDVFEIVFSKAIKPEEMRVKLIEVLAKYAV